MPDGTNMTPENPYNQFKIGEPTQPVGGEMKITPQFGAKAELPESKMPDIDQDKIGPDQGHNLRIGMKAKNEAEPTKQDSEIPPWFYGDRDSGLDRESKLANNYEPMKVINLMVELGELADPEERVRVGKKLEKKGGVEAKEVAIIKELDRYTEMAIGAGQDKVLSVAMMIESIQEPSDYVVQMETRYFETADQGLVSLARYFKRKLPDLVEPWYRKLDESLTQQKSTINVLRAAGAAAPAYYDALRHTGETLIDRMRFHANATDLRGGFSKEDPGVTVLLSLTDRQKKSIKDTIAETEPRKEQLRMNDDARDLIMAASAVSQIDIIDGCNYREADGSTTRKDTFKALSPQRERFIKLYFGEMDESKWKDYKAKDWTGKERTVKIPANIEVWYADSDKLKDREAWLSKMVAAVEWKDKATKLGLWDSLDKMTDVQILSMAQALNQEATKIRGMVGDKVSNSSLERGASKIANINWIQLDKTLMAAGRMSWKFYYKDIAGVTRRFKEGGGIYKGFDTGSLMYPWDKYLGYKATWKATTQFFIASSDAMRKEKYKHRPDWMPSLSEGLANDKRMKKIWDSLFKPEYHGFRARMLAGVVVDKDAQAANLKNADKTADLDPEIVEYLEKHTYAYETAYQNAEGKNIVLPMSIPTELEFMNFWQNVQLTNSEVAAKITAFDGKTDSASNKLRKTLEKDLKESVWEKLQRGVKMSEIDFSNVNYEAIDRMWVGGSMLVRLAKFWIDPYEAKRDPVLAAFFESAGTQSVSELGKRVFLTFRDLPIGYRKFIAGILPDMIAMYEAHNSGIMGTELGTPDGITQLKRWNFRMAKWIRAFKWMPNIMYDEENLYMEKEEILQKWEGIKNLGNDLALITITKKMAIERIAQAAYKADRSALSAAYNGLLSVYDDPDMAGAFVAETGEPNTIASLRSVKPIQFEVRSESDIESDLFGRK